MATQVIGYKSDRGVVSPTDVAIAIVKDSNVYVIGTATGISVSIDRRKIPLYALGYVDPIAIGRGTRLISGVIDFVAINLSAVNSILNNIKDAIYITPQEKEARVAAGINTTDELGSSQEQSLTNPNISGAFYKLEAIKFLDELPPVDIYAYGVSETTGKAMFMKIVNVDFMSVDWAITMNDVASAERVTFIARHIIPWHPAE